MTLHQRYQYHRLVCVGFRQKDFKKETCHGQLTASSIVLIVVLLTFEDYTYTCI